MSSTLEHEAPVHASPAIPRVETPAAVPAASGPAADAAVTSDPEARGFSNAIILGATVGVVVWTAVISLLVKWQMPNLEWIAVVGIGAWTGIFGGTFLGGTITVGRWSGRHH
jgi:hypothetical protein